MVDPLWRCKVGPRQVLCWVSDAVALGPLLVTLDTGKRAGKGEATGAAVLMGADVA